MEKKANTGTAIPPTRYIYIYLDGFLYTHRRLFILPCSVTDYSGYLPFVMVTVRASDAADILPRPTLAARGVRQRECSRIGSQPRSSLWTMAFGESGGQSDAAEVVVSRWGVAGRCQEDACSLSRSVMPDPPTLAPSSPRRMMWRCREVVVPNRPPKPRTYGARTTGGARTLACSSPQLHSESRPWSFVPTPHSGACVPLQTGRIIHAAYATTPAWNQPWKLQFHPSIHPSSGARSTPGRLPPRRRRHQPHWNSMSPAAPASAASPST